MKKFMTNIKTLAALLIAGAAFTACSSSDDDIIEQPQKPTEPQVYTLVIKATKGGASQEQNGTRSSSAEAQPALGEAKGDATTRALSLDGSTLKASWSGTETIEVYQNGEKMGTATAAPSPNGNTTITATLTSAPDPSGDLYFYLGGYTPDYTGQVGLLTGTNSISEKYDYAMDALSSGSYTVDEINKKIIPGDYEPLEFGAAKQAIIKFTLKDKANNTAINPSALTISDGTSTVSLTSIPASTYSANGDGVLYVAFSPSGENKTITLTATVGDDTYTYSTPSTKTFWCGQYYDITVKMTKQPRTVTWNATKIDSESLALNLIDEGYNSDEKSSDGITVTVCTGEFGDQVQFATYLYIGGGWGSITFTSSVGKISKIEINHSDDGQWNDEAGTGWPAAYNQSSGGTYTWSGSPSTSVTLEGEGHLIDITSIVFTLE